MSHALLVLRQEPTRHTPTRLALSKAVDATLKLTRFSRHLRCVGASCPDWEENRDACSVSGGVQAPRDGART